MKKNIKISRAGFPGVGNFSWINYLSKILSKKYNILIDSKNPDLILYSNLYYNSNQIDYYTNDLTKGCEDYPDNIIKIFISGEANPNYQSHLNKGDNYYVLGYEHINHQRYLRFPTYVLDAFVLNNEGGMFDDSFSWLTDKSKLGVSIKDKTHFCSVVQSSENKDRGKMFDLISSKFYIKSSGPWRPTIERNEELNRHKYHNYNNPDYMGKIDGLTYRDKINFFKNCFFNLSFQYTNTKFLTQEKIIHAFASNSIPIFFGNSEILNEGFNQESFINVHDYRTFEDCFDYICDVYENKKLLNSYFSSPFFIDNKLPNYFYTDYILNFLEPVLDKI